MKQDAGKERDVSVHETEISVADDTLIKSVDLSKEEGLEKEVTKVVLIAEEKDVWVHEIEITIASIPAQEKKGGSI